MNRAALVAAINPDCGNRSNFKTLFTKDFVVLDGIRDTIRHLKRLMKPMKRHIDAMVYGLPAREEPFDPSAAGRGGRGSCRRTSARRHYPLGDVAAGVHAAAGWAGTTAAPASERLLYVDQFRAVNVRIGSRASAR